MADIAQVQIDKMESELERRIWEEYSKAYQEISEDANEYFAMFQDELELEHARLVSGEITKQEFQAWERAEFAQGERWRTLRKTMATRLTETNKIAAAYINDDTPTIFSIAQNYEQYKVEQAYDNVSFSIFNEQAVKRLIKDNPKILPKVKINTKKDVAWNQKKLQSALISGILRGNSPERLADEFKAIANMNEASARRNAITAYTGAQNGGRQECMNRTKDAGLDVLKEWIAVGDKKTRDSHARLDGVRVPVDEPFPNGLMFPGDPDGDDPAEIFNCRCAMKSVFPGINDALRTNNTKESYQEWLNRKELHEINSSMVVKNIGLDSSYTGVGTTEKFNDYMLKNHPEAFGDIDVVYENIRADYNKEFGSRISLYNAKIGDIKLTTPSKYENMNYRDQMEHIITYKHYKDTVINRSGQKYASEGSIMEGLAKYEKGAIKDGYGTGKGARIDFDEKYGISDFIDSNPDVHYNGGATYRGLKVNKTGLNDLHKAFKEGTEIDMRGLSSWTTTESVAKEFAERSLRGRATDSHVIFVDETSGSRNAIPFPYSSEHLMSQDEVLYSASNKFIITQIEEDGDLIYVKLKRL